MRAGLGVALVGLVVCVGCGLSKSPQEKAVAAIEALGGVVKSDKNGAVVKVNLGAYEVRWKPGYNQKVTDAALVHLKGMTNLQTLILQGAAVTDAGLVHLKGLTKLKTLFLYTTLVTDVGLVHLKELTQLEELLLGNTKITDAGLAHLKGLTNLKHLDLHKTDITDAGLTHLKGLKNLEVLQLMGTKVTESGFKKHAKAFPNCLMWR